MNNFTLPATTETLENYLNTRHELILVDFWASWCGPCNAMDITLEQVVSTMNAKVLILKVNIDEEPLLAKKFSIRSVPTLMMFYKGSFIESKTGLMSAERLQTWIESRVPS